MTCLLKKVLTGFLCITLLMTSAAFTPSFATNNDVSDELSANMEEVTLSHEKHMTPTMGWASWNALGHGISTSALEAQMDALVSTGLKDAGYNFFNIDDTYQNGRDEVTGRLKINTTKFPGGAADMKALADRAHSMGLYAGIYSDGGDNNCSSGNDAVNKPWGIGVGLLNHEIDDLHMYLDDGIYTDTYATENPDEDGIECWGYDFIKVDWCGGGHAGLNDEAQYTKIGNIIKEIEAETGKDKVYNICRWAYVGPWQLKADSWRIGGDIDMSGNSFDSVMVQVDKMKSLSYLTGPGHVNDPDMMVVGKGLTPTEDKTHFALWCMFSAPLMIGCNLTTISQDTVDLLTNSELIAINQDPACLSASFNGAIGNNIEVWVKPLGSADSDNKALALVNRSNVAQTVTFDFADIGYSGNVAMRDLFTGTDLEAAKSYTVTLASHETAVLKLTPTEANANSSIITSVSHQNGSLAFEGIDGKDYTVFATPAENCDFDYTDETTSFTVVYPYTATEKTAHLYLTGAIGTTANVEISLGAKKLTKAVTLSDDYTSLDMKFFTGASDERLTATVSGALGYAASVTGTVTPTATASLSATVPAAIDLTSVGSADWLYYGTKDGVRGVRKADGGRQISVSTVGGESASAVSGVSYSWSDGDSTVKSTSSLGSTVTYGEGTFYDVTFPADSMERSITMPVATFSADGKVELFVGDECLFTESFTGTSGAKTTRLFTATYSADVRTKAVVRLTLTNEYTTTGCISLDGIALSEASASGYKFSAAADVDDYSVDVNAADYIIYGTAESRKEDAYLIPDYYVNGETSVTKTSAGDSISGFGSSITLPLPLALANGLSRADIALEVKDCTVGLTAYSGGEKSYTSITDTSTDGELSSLATVWYGNGENCGVIIEIKAASSENASVTLKSLTFDGGLYTADYPTLAEEDGILTATAVGEESLSSPVKLALSLYNTSDVMVAENISAESTSANLTASVSIPEGFTEGYARVHLADSSDSIIGYTSRFAYPIGMTQSSADVENRIGGITAKYYVENKGATLLDVRSAEEFAEGHLENAVNIEYTDIINSYTSAFPDKDAYIVCYCATAKRSAQAVLTLTALGYTNVYNLGDMAAYNASSELSLTDATSATWTVGSKVFITTPNISQYDDVSVKYAVGSTKTESDAAIYDGNGIALADENGSCTVKAYLMFNETDELVTSAEETYTLLIEKPAYGDVDIFLTDLPSFFAGGSRAGYTKKDIAVNGTSPITIDGETYSKGVTMNGDTSTAGSHVTAEVPANAEYFTAVAGIETTQYSSQKATFHVYFDDVEYAVSPELGKNEYYVFKVKIPEGAETVKLWAEGPPACNHCAWGFAGFMLDPSKVIPDVATLGVSAYMSDLAFTASESNYFGKDVSLKDKTSPIIIAGTTYAKGFAINGRPGNGSSISSPIPSGSNKFYAVAGMASTANASRKTTFSVYVDGVLAASSAEMSKGDYHVFAIDLPADAGTIKLVSSTDNADTSHCGWGICAFTEAQNGYLSDNGADANDGLTPLTPKKTLAAAEAVCDADGCVIVTDTYTVTASNSISCGKDSVTVKGYGTSSKFVLGYANALACDVTFSNIILERADGSNREVPLRVNGYDLTVGSGVTVSQYMKESGKDATTRGWNLAQNDYTDITGIDSTTTIESGSWSNVYAGDNYGNASGISRVIIDGTASIGALGLNHQSNPKSVFSGKAYLTVDGGTVSKLYLGSAGKGGSDATVYAVINGGTVGSVNLTSKTGGNYSGAYASEAVLQTGTNVLEINGGTISSKTISSPLPNMLAKRVVIFNNGLAEGFTVNDAKAIVVKNTADGVVHAQIDDYNDLTGFTVETLFENVYVNGVKNSNYTVVDGKNVFTVPAPTEGTVLNIAYEQTAYTVSYNLNGGSGTAPENQVVLVGDLVALPKTVNATNGDKTFCGWSDSAEGTNVLHAYVAEKNDKEFFAVWTDSFDTSYYQNLYKKLMSGNAVISYFGGSITYADGLSKYGNDVRNAESWRGITRDWFGSNFNCNITEVNGAINGTGSRFASYRATEHLKLDTTPPDLLFIEFAINDAYEFYTETEIRECMSVVLKKALTANPYCNFCFILTTDQNKLANDFPTLTYHRQFAEDFGIPYIDVGKAVVADMGGNGNLWNVEYFSDWVHPDKKGNLVYANTIIDYFTGELIEKKLDATASSPISYTELEDVDTDRHLFYYTDLPNAHTENRVNMTNEWSSLGYSTNGARMAFKFTGTNALIWASLCRFNADIDVYIDGSHTPSNTLDQWRNDDWTQNYLFECSTEDLPYGEHTVVMIPRTVLHDYASKSSYSLGERFLTRGGAIKGGHDVINFEFIPMPNTVKYINPEGLASRSFYKGFATDVTNVTESINTDVKEECFASGESIVKTSWIPTAEGKRFSHWSQTEGGDAVDFEQLTMGSETITLYAVFTQADGALINVSFTKCGTAQPIIKTTASDGYDYDSSAIFTLVNKDGNTVFASISESEIAGNTVAFDAVPNGSYRLTVQKNGYVAYEKDIDINAPTEINLDPITLIPGDIKGSYDDICGDGKVDIDDFLRVLRGFATEAVEKLKSCIDINEDGYVTVEDLTYVKANFNNDTSSYAD